MACVIAFVCAHGVRDCACLCARVFVCVCVCAARVAWSGSQEAERQAQVNLNKVKAAQYQADLAAHKRRERMKELKAKNERSVQETAWEDVMAWNEKTTQETHTKKLEDMGLFVEQRQKLAVDYSGTAASLLEQQRIKEEERTKRRRAANARRRAQAAVQTELPKRRSPRSKSKGTELKSPKSPKSASTERPRRLHLHEPTWMAWKWAGELSTTQLRYGELE